MKGARLSREKCSCSCFMIGKEDYWDWDGFLKFLNFIRTAPHNNKENSS